MRRQFLNRHFRNVFIRPFGNSPQKSIRANRLPVADITLKIKQNIRCKTAQFTKIQVVVQTAAEKAVELLDDLRIARQAMDRSVRQNPRKNMFRKRTAEADIDKAVTAGVRLPELIFAVARYEKTLFGSDLILLLRPVRSAAEKLHHPALGILQNHETIRKLLKQILIFVIGRSLLKVAVSGRGNRRRNNITALVFLPEVDPDILFIAAVKVNLQHPHLLFL